MQNSLFEIPQLNKPRQQAYSQCNVSGCRILHLTLSKMPFEVMVTGEKSTEYREPSKWILSRLQGKDYDLIKFVNGYGSDKPYFIAKFR